MLMFERTYFFNLCVMNLQASRNPVAGGMGANNMGSMSMSRWTSFGGGFQNETGGDVTTQLNGGCEENPETRKIPPRPIGMERSSWKQHAGGHPDAYQAPGFQAYTSPHQPMPQLHQQTPHPLIHQQPCEDMNMDRYQVR